MGNERKIKGYCLFLDKKTNEHHRMIGAESKDEFYDLFTTDNKGIETIHLFNSFSGETTEIEKNDIVDLVFFPTMKDLDEYTKENNIEMYWSE
jgi:hypothetical protein